MCPWVQTPTTPKETHTQVGFDNTPEGVLLRECEANAKGIFTHRRSRENQHPNSPLTVAPVQSMHMVASTFHSGNGMPPQTQIICRINTIVQSRVHKTYNTQQAARPPPTPQPHTGYFFFLKATLKSTDLPLFCRDFLTRFAKALPNSNCSSTDSSVYTSCVAFDFQRHCF